MADRLADSSRQLSQVLVDEVGDTCTNRIEVGQQVRDAHGSIECCQMIEAEQFYRLLETPNRLKVLEVPDPDLVETRDLDNQGPRSDFLCGPGCGCTFARRRNLDVQGARPLS